MKEGLIVQDILFISTVILSFEIRMKSDWKILLIVIDRDMSMLRYTISVT
jgi:hypothetical protein